MKESTIMHERGRYWVHRDTKASAYVVYRHSDSWTHGVSDSAYTLDQDGLSIAVSRCDYLAKREGA